MSKTAYIIHKNIELEEAFPMNDSEELQFIKMEYMRILKENEGLLEIIAQLNQTLNRLIKHYMRQKKSTSLE